MVFGRLTVLRKDAACRKYKKWECQCSCGCFKSIYDFNLKSGSSTSCGCLQKELARQRTLGVPSPTAHSTHEFIAAAKAVHGEKYDYTCTTYSNCEDKVSIICKTCKLSWQSKPRNHLSGKGCPTCAVSGFKTSLTAHFYVLECGDMLKVGVTNRQPYTRARQVSAGHGRTFNILKAYSFNTGQQALDLETDILKFLRSNYESPPYTFVGATECFFHVDVDSLLQHIEKYIQ